MSLYENQKCPVCGIPFKDGDDIVTCPECGTPHHRHCYEKAGRCANYGLHAQGFDYRRSLNENQQAQQSSAQHAEEYYVPRDRQGAGSVSGQQPPKSEYTHIPMGSGMEQGNKTTFVFKNDEKIDGFLLADIITVIGSNFMKFITKFRRNKKINWNWGAFVFGPYYLFFRKMYGQGTLFLAVEFAARVVLNFIFSKQFSAFSTGFAAMANEPPESYGEYLSQLSSLMDSSGVMQAYLILFAVLFAIHTIIAMISDGIYRRRVFSLITDVDTKLESGAVTPVSPFGFQGNEDMSQAEIRKLFLAGRGGVSFTAPCLAYLVLSLISNLIAYL